MVKLHGLIIVKNWFIMKTRIIGHLKSKNPPIYFMQGPASKNIFLINVIEIGLLQISQIVSISFIGPPH